MIKWLLSKLPKRKKKDTTQVYTVDDVIPSEPDDRDFLSTVSTLPIPKSYEITNRPPIRNQLQLGSCASFSVVRAWEIMLLNSDDRFFEGSELFHFYEGRKRQRVFPNNSGMTLRNACHTFLKFGMASEFFHPYNTRDFNAEPYWWTYKVAEQFKPIQYERLTSIDEIKHSVVEGVPVIFGIWTDSTFQRLNIINSVWRPPQRGRYGHAMVIVGYNSTGFVVDNSWGPVWGNRGTCIIPYNIFRQYSWDWFRIIT